MRARRGRFVVTSGALSRLGCGVVHDVLIFPVLRVLHAPPAACAAAHVMCHDEEIWLTVGWSETSPPNRKSASPAVWTPPSRARVRVRAPQSVFDFFLHLFTRVRQLLDSKKDRGEDFVRKRGYFLHFLGVSA